MNSFSWGRLVPLFFAICMALVLTGCGKLTDGRFRVEQEKMNHAMERVVGAAMSTNAVDVHGRIMSMFTTMMDFRFTCTEAELQDWLRRSPYLPDELEPRLLGVESKSIPEHWWRPYEMETNYCGAKASWKLEKDSVQCGMMVGRLKPPTAPIYTTAVEAEAIAKGGTGIDTNRVTVFLSLTLEALPQEEAQARAAQATNGAAGSVPKP